jgi:hypothetical protein
VERWKRFVRSGHLENYKQAEKMSIGDGLMRVLSDELMTDDKREGGREGENCCGSPQSAR